MGVDNVLNLKVRGLIFTGRISIAELDHSVVGTEGEAAAFDIDPLAEFVVVVKGVLADFQLDAAGGVLNVKALVDIAAAIFGNNLTAYDYVLLDLDRTGFVQCLELGDGRVRSHRHRLIDISPAVVRGEDLIPLLAGS